MLYINDFAGYVDNAEDMYADNSTLQTYTKDIKSVENQLTDIDTGYNNIMDEDQ